MTDETEPQPIYVEDQTAGAYLTQARDAFLECSRPHRLYRDWVPAAQHDASVNRVRAHSFAQTRQLGLARTSILFSALAAEAYVNRFLNDNLKAADFDAIEKMPTIEKYVLGTEFALKRKVFARNQEPAQSVGALFKLRHDLVHPKAKRVEFDRGRLMDSRFEQFNPYAAGNFLVAVAFAAATLYAESRRKREPHAIIETLLRDASKIRELGKSVRDGLPEPPPQIEFTAPSSSDDREPGALEVALSKAYEAYDPLKAPRTVPQPIPELVNYLASQPGTATGPLPSTPYTGGAAAQPPRDQNDSKPL